MITFLVRGCDTAVLQLKVCSSNTRGNQYDNEDAREDSTVLFCFWWSPGHRLRTLQNRQPLR